MYYKVPANPRNIFFNVTDSTKIQLKESLPQGEPPYMLLTSFCCFGLTVDAVLSRLCSDIAVMRMMKCARYVRFDVK